MLLNRIIIPVCIALAAMSSNAFALEDDIGVTPKYVAKNKGMFDVKVAACEGGIKFTFVRFVRKPQYWIGEIKIRKGGRMMVECQLRPAKAKKHVRYVFTVSQDVIPESEFVLHETGVLRKVGQREFPQMGGTNYHFRLQHFVSSAKPGR